MKKIIIILLFCTILSGCATYNAAKDPVYQAYLRGEITYAEYVDHYHKLMAGQRARAMMFQRSMSQIADDISPKRRKYTVKDEFGMPVGSIEEEY